MSYKCCEGVRGLKFSRRYFLKQGGVAMVGLSAMPAFLQRAVAATPMPNKKQLVVLFQRGAADGLNIVVPFGESNYYRMRPTIAIPQPNRGGTDAAIDLDGFFGLHPSLAPLEPLFHKNQLGIGHAGPESDRRRLAEPRSGNCSEGELFAFPRRGDGAEPPAHAAWRSAGNCAAGPEAVQSDGAGAGNGPNGRRRL